MLQSAGRRHAYVCCADSLRPPQLLSAVVSQLSGSKRKREDGYVSAASCDSVGELLQKLPGALLIVA